MRENTKWIMLLTAAAFVALMVFEWGMDLSGRSSAQASGGEIGRINGESISYERYFQVYQNLYQQQQQAQEEAITSVQNREIEEAAWDQLVVETLLQQELRRRGIRATDEEVGQAARFAPPPEFMSNELFQTDGQFDLQKYHQFLASPAVDQRLLDQLEAYYRDMIPRSKLVRQVSAGVWVPDAELWRMWRDQTETVRARFLVIDPATAVPDAAVSVSEREIADYYAEHEDEFERPARAEVRFLALDRAPTAADTVASRARAARVRQEILDGAEFAEVATRESADPGSAAQGGSLGAFQRGQMVPAFDQAVWSLPIGEIGEPVQTQFGFHIIRVDRREGDEAEASHILIPIERTDRSENALLERTDSLEDLTERYSLEQAAQRLGMRVRSAEITEVTPVIPGIGPVDEGATWALEEAEAGEVSEIFETPAAYYTLELVSKTPARTLTRAEAEPTIRAILLKEKKLEKAREQGRQIVDRVRAGQTLEQVAAAGGLEVRDTEPFARVAFVPGLGRANAATGAAFGLQPGQVSGAVEANGAIYVLQTIERTEADRAAWEQQKELQRARVMQALEQERWSRYLAALREEAEIVDFRDQVLRGSGDQDVR